MSEEVLSSDKRSRRNDGLQKIFGETPVNFSDIDRILTIPEIDDMAGILARANFKNDEVRIAYLQCIEKARRLLATVKPGDVWYEPAKGILLFLRDSLASTLGMLGFGKTLQLQAKTELIAPSLIREQLSLSKRKKEETIRGSDFRVQTDDKEPRAGRDNTHGL